MSVPSDPPGAQGNDPESYVASSVAAITCLHQRRKASAQDVLLAFIPFRIYHRDIGREDPDTRMYRLLNVEVTKYRRVADDDKSTVWFRTNDENEDSFVLTPGRQFEDQRTGIPIHYGATSFSKDEYILARKIGDFEGYEPVGIDVALYLPERAETDVKFGEKVRYNG